MKAADVRVLVRVDEAIVERVARIANPAFDAATHEATREAWRNEARRYLVAFGAALKGST